MCALALLSPPRPSLMAKWDSHLPNFLGPLWHPTPIQLDNSLGLYAPGLTLNSTDGSLSGTPTAAGGFSSSCSSPTLRFTLNHANLLHSHRSWSLNYHHFASGPTRTPPIPPHSKHPAAPRRTPGLSLLAPFLQAWYLQPMEPSTARQPRTAPTQLRFRSPTAARRRLK